MTAPTYANRIIRAKTLVKAKSEVSKKGIVFGIQWEKILNPNTNETFTQYNVIEQSKGYRDAGRWLLTKGGLTKEQAIALFEKKTGLEIVQA